MINGPTEPIRPLGMATFIDLSQFFVTSGNKIRIIHLPNSANN